MEKTSLINPWFYKLTTGQSEDYTTGCLLDYEHIEITD